jgi:hypothetical protein
VNPRIVRSTGVSISTRWFGLAAAWTVAWATLGAADFWTAKQYEAWSEKEVVRMLNDSPWSQQATIVLYDFSLAGRVGGLSGGVLGTGGNSGRTRGGGGVGGDGAGNLGGGSFMGPPEKVVVAVRWTSALPVRQALVRNGQAPHERLADTDLFYRVAVVGLPLPVAQTGGTIAQLLEATALRRKNKPPISAAAARYDYEQTLVTFEFDFPRDEPLVIGDDEIEFVAAFGQPLRKKFKLKDMMLAGRLEL